MYLEVVVLSCGHAGVGQGVRIEPKRAQRVVDQGTQSVRVADEGAAADERDAEHHAFFLGEAKHLNGAVRRRVLRKRDAQDDAQDAVERARVRHGVEVRPDEQRGGAGGAFASTDVARAVHAHVESRLAHPRADQRVDLAHGC